MNEIEPVLIDLTDAEILCAMWISRKIADEKKKCFEGILGQVLEIMLRDKILEKDKAIVINKKGLSKNRPEYYINKINYSWVGGKDKYNMKGFSSSELCAAVKLALIESKKTGRNFTFLFGIALEVIMSTRKELLSVNSKSI